MEFSTSTAQEVICVREDVYAGRSRYSSKRVEPTPLALTSIAERVKILQRPLGAKEVVQEILSMTTDSREARQLVTKTIKSRWGKLPKVPPQESLAVTPILAKDYFWQKEPDLEKITEINPLLLVEGEEDRTRATLTKIKELVAANPKPMTIRK